MSKQKLNSVLFEYMEKMTKECKYNYEQFIHELSRFVECFYNSYYSHYYETLKDKELKPYFIGVKKEETLEKLLKAYIFGYEEESDKYTIVLFERNGWKYVLWEIQGDYQIASEEEYFEMDDFKKAFTMEEIVKKFPQLETLAQKNK